LDVDVDVDSILVLVVRVRVVLAVQILPIGNVRVDDKCGTEKELPTERNASNVVAKQQQDKGPADEYSYRIARQSIVLL